MRLVVVTGVSGAGKSTALRALEDLGFYAVDNLPLPLVPKLIELLSSRPDIDRVALGLDARGGNFLDGASKIFGELRERGHSVEILFLEASDEILIRRFSETRRRHPLSDTDIRAGVAAERRTLAGLRREVDALVDTGALNVHVLRGLIQERYGRGEGDLAITLLSFGFKHGIPSEADIVLDVRFLPNPFFVPELSALSGEDEAVAKFVLENPETVAFINQAEKLLRLSVQGFMREGKAYATVAIGCTGGRHRSVAIAKELGHRLGGEHPISVRHRDITHGASQ
jgi:RNase adapter protein RapZ